MESRTRGTFLRIRVLVLFDLLSLCDLGVLSGAGVRIGSVGGTVSDKEAVGIYRFDGIGLLAHCRCLRLHGWISFQGSARDFFISHCGLVGKGSHDDRSLFGIVFDESFENIHAGVMRASVVFDGVLDELESR